MGVLKGGPSIIDDVLSDLDKLEQQQGARTDDASIPPEEPEPAKEDDEYVTPPPPPPETTVVVQDYDQGQPTVTQVLNGLDPVGVAGWAEFIESDQQLDAASALDLDEPEPAAERLAQVGGSDPDISLVSPSPDEPEPEPQQELAVKPMKVELPEFSVGDVTDITDLRKFVTRVTLKTRRWTARAKDRKAAADAESASHATVGAVNAYKNLMHGADSELKAVNKALDEARRKHYQLTLPWSVYSGDDDSRRTGPRLLVNTRYFDYVEEMAKQQQEVRSRLDDFIPKYADLKDKAKQALADLFDESKYPAIATIRDQFGLDFDFETLPKGDAFEGSSLANDQATALASALTKRSQLAMRNAMQEVWQRSYKAVSHMAERLSDPEGRFKATTLDNVSEAAELLKHCNLTRDPRLDQLYKEIQGKLTHHDPKELRKNKETRAAVAADARTIRDKIRELGAA